jgi:hypothetical protein
VNRILPLALAVFFLSSFGLAQKPGATPAGAQASNTSAAPQLKGETAAQLAAKVPEPKSKDVESTDAILRAIYDVISGPAGGRDWKRFRSLFVPQARFTQASTATDGAVSVVLWGVDDFINMARPIFAQEPFFENAIVNRVQRYGHVAQVFSSYESRHAPGEKPFQRGINSIQLFNDGKRWWVLSILWDAERPDNLLPPQFAIHSQKTK